MAEKKRFVLRINADAMSALERWASDEFRSVNGQLEFLLARALREAGRTPRRKAGEQEEEEKQEEEPS